MKPALHKLFLLAGSAALVLAGCTKQPRPDPTLTTQTGPVQPLPPPQQFPQQQPGFRPTDVPIEQGLTARPLGSTLAEGDPSILAAQTVYFDLDQSAIKVSERAKLKAAKEHLDKHPEHRVILVGYCDWRGTAEYNLALGDRRANSAKKYLQSLGVPADRLDTVSKGSLEAAKNADEATMAKDRRVDLVVVSAGAPGGPLPGPLPVGAPMRPPGAR
jgi:peptidoglycan-associated lipoprotein